MVQENKSFTPKSDNLALSTIHQANLFVQTIQYDNKCDKLDEAETTLFFLLSALVGENDKEFAEISLTPKEIQTYLGVNLHGGANQKNWVDRFKALPRKLYKFMSDDGSFETGAYFQYCKYDAKTRKYIVCLNSKLSESLLQLKNSGRAIFPFGWLWSLKASGKKLYAIGCSVKNLNKNRLYYKKETLMSILGSGHSEKNFISECLKPTLEEIKNKTNITIIATPVKVGKKVVAFVLDCNSKSIQEIEEKRLAPQYPNIDKEFVNCAHYNPHHECLNPLNTTTQTDVIAAAVQDRDLFDTFSKKELTFVTDRISETKIDTPHS